jgi:hypothetical protein
MRIEREVRALDAIDHPNEVPLRDFVADGPAIVLAWMSGGTLESMMQSPIAPGRAVEFAAAPRSSQDWVIRGASDWIVIDFLGGAIPSGGVVDLMVEVEEDPYLGAQS